jgi:hypothetical protein
MIEQWLLIIWLTSKQVGLTTTSYDTQIECVRALEQWEHDASVEVVCMQTMMKVGRPKHKKKKPTPSVG